MTAPPRAAPLRVLIVEDEALLALELEAMVEDEGHVVVGSADDAASAALLAARGAADLAFVDVHLADGPTGVAVARGLMAGGGVAVVFMTANAGRLPDDCAGALGVVAKPYTRGGVRAALGYLAQGLRAPPPALALPASLRLSADGRARWPARA